MTCRHLGIIVFTLTGVASAQQWTRDQPGPDMQRRQLVFDAARNQALLLGDPEWADPGAEFAWRYRAGSWSPLRTAHTPPLVNNPTQQHPYWYHCAYDPTRQRVVLVTQEHQSPQTWEFDGSDWAQVTTATSLLGRSSSAMAYDGSRQRMVLFGGWSQYGLLYDLWEYDGVDWQARGAVNPPPVRYAHSLAYDAARSCLVMFGGIQGTYPSTYLTDTWELHGSTWTQVPTTSNPPWNSQLVWHDGLQRVATTQGDTVWSFDGVDWTALPAAPAGTVGGSLLTYDSSGDRLLLVGHDTLTWNGTAWSNETDNPPSGDAALATDLAGNACFCRAGGRTFERRDGRWRQLVSGSEPPAQPSERLAYDTHRDALVLVADDATNNATTVQTLLRVGGNWLAVTPAHAPSRRTDFALAYHPGRRTTMLFGGATGYQVPNDELWEFDGTDWHLVPTPTAPPARHRHGMVYDSTRDALLVFGGNDWSLTPLPDTWLFDAGGWHQQLTPSAPFQGAGHAMGFDPWRGHAVLHGGVPAYYQALPSDETWRFDGTDWQPVSTTNAPLPRYGAAMAFDPGQGHLILVGGVSAWLGYQPWPATRGALALDLPAQAIATRYGAGCPGSNGTPSLAATGAPSLGGIVPLQLQSLPTAPGLAWLAFGFGIDRWNGQALPFDLGALGLSGCDLWIAAESSLGALVQHPGSTATWPLPLPASPIFAGAHVAAQALVLDPASARAATVSNALLLTLQ